MKKILIPSLAVAAALALACSSGNSDPDGTPIARASGAAKAGQAAGRAPVPDDFILGVKVTRKHCFGTAGCNVTFHITVTSEGGFDEDGSYQVTYQVDGVEDGPYVSTFTVQGGNYSGVDSEDVSTASASSKLRASVTDVEKVG